MRPLVPASVVSSWMRKNAPKSRWSSPRSGVSSVKTWTDAAPERDQDHDAGRLFERPAMRADDSRAARARPRG